MLFFPYNSPIESCIDDALQNYCQKPSLAIWFLAMTLEEVFNKTGLKMGH